MRVRATVIAAVAAVGVMGTTAQAAGGLTQQQYDALHAGYSAADAISDGSSPAEAVGKLKEACAKIGSADRLLASQQRTCLAAAEWLPALSLTGCDDSAENARAAISKGACLTSIRKAKTSTTRLLTAARADRQAVAAAVSAPACRAVLWTPKGDLADLRSAERGFALLQRALVRGSSRDASRAQRALRKLDLGGDEGDSDSNQAKKLAAHCKPS